MAEEQDTNSGDGTGLNFGEATDPNDATRGSGVNLGDSDNYARDAAGNIILNADGSPRKRRGPKRGSNRTGSGKTSSGKISVSGVETLLVGIFAGVAMFTKCPEVALEKDESGPLSKAVAEVAELYPMPDLTEKAVKWTALAMCAGPMVVAKGILIKERVSADRAKNTKELV